MTNSGRQKFIVVNENNEPMAFDNDQFYKIDSISIKSKRKKFKLSLECYDIDELNNLLISERKYRAKNNFSFSERMIIPFEDYEKSNLSINSYNKAIQTIIEDLTFDDNDECTISKHFFVNRIIKTKPL